MLHYWNMYVCSYGTTKCTANILFKDVLNDLICVYELLGLSWICRINLFSLYSVWHVKWKSSFLYRININCILRQEQQCFTVMAHSTVSSTITVTDWLCACRGQLVQHSLTVITINSRLTQFTAGADQMCTDICAISCQLSTVHIVTQCDIKPTNLPHT